MPDSDDSYDLDLLSKAHEAIVAASCPDAVMFGYAEDYYDADGGFLYDHELLMDAGAYASSEEWRPRVIGFERGTHYGYAWNKLYRLDRIKDMALSFQQVRLIEDILFNVGYFQDARSLVVLPGTPYRYAKRQGKSLTNANSFSAAEYFALHRRRVQTLRDQLESWGVFDESCRGVLGSLYGRYILSALERNCFPAEQLTHRQRVKWCRSLFADPLFDELIPSAKAESSRALKLCLVPLRWKSALLCTAMGRAVFFAHSNLYGLFTRLRSGR